MCVRRWDSEIEKQWDVRNSGTGAGPGGNCQKYGKGPELQRKVASEKLPAQEGFKNKGI